MDKRERERRLRYGFHLDRTIVKGDRKPCLAFGFGQISGVRQRFWKFCLGISVEEGQRSRKVVFLCDSGFLTTAPTADHLRNLGNTVDDIFWFFEEHSDECSLGFLREERESLMK